MVLKPNNLATWIRETREERRLSLMQLSRASGTPVNTLSRWECGLNPPPLAGAVAVIDALGYEVEIIPRE